jgi:hypothetical protein
VQKLSFSVLVLPSDPGTQLLDVWVDQIWRISAIASRQFQVLRWAVTLLGTALVLGDGRGRRRSDGRPLNDPPHPQP